jgi:hypothetical protein
MKDQIARIALRLLMRRGFDEAGCSRGQSQWVTALFTAPDMMRRLRSLGRRSTIPIEPFPKPLQVLCN